MYRVTIVILLFSILVTACSNEEPNTKNPPTPDEKSTQEETVANDKVITEDEKVTFEINNYVNASQKELDKIKKDILNAYNVITNSINTDYVPANEITIHLLYGSQASFGGMYEVNLYTSSGSDFPLVHELTHSLLGYGEDFKGNKGYFTQEGYATYLENKHGTQVTDVHKFMRYFIDENKNIPVYKLIDKKYDHSLFRPLLVEPEDHTLQTMSYIHAASFVTYLIDTYGLGKFEQIYNKNNLKKKFEKTYGKNTEDLEEEWINYIKQNIEFTPEDRLKLDTFYSINSTISWIDSEVFERE